MFRVKNAIGILLIFTAFVANSHAQASLSIERSQALIGDQLQLTLQVNTPTSNTWINTDQSPADTVSAIEVISSGEVQTSSNGGYTQYLKTWKIAVFDTGMVRIPSMPIVLQSSMGTDTQYTNDIPIMISGVADSLGLAPIKPIIVEPAKFSDYLPYILGVVGIALLVFLAILWRRRKPKQQEIIEIRDVKPAHMIAFEKLDKLEQDKLWQQGLVKEYHSRLNYIVREYLQHRYQVPALESTSTEIIRHLRAIDLPAELTSKFREVMEVEDLIKFAKAEPPVDIHAQYLEFARSVIRQTKLEIQTSANV